MGAICPPRGGEKTRKKKGGGGTLQQPYSPFSRKRGEYTANHGGKKRGSPKGGEYSPELTRIFFKKKKKGRRGKSRLSKTSA